MKSKNSESYINIEGINAEFKKLRKRIERLEQIVLNQTQDSGKISESVNKLKKG